MKNELLHPIKPVPMEPPVHKEPVMRLEKKPSKKLVIKANDRVSESVNSEKREKKETDNLPESESVVINHDHVIMNKREEPKKE